MGFVLFACASTSPPFQKISEAILALEKVESLKKAGGLSPTEMAILTKSRAAYQRAKKAMFTQAYEQANFDINHSLYLSQSILATKDNDPTIAPAQKTPQGN